MISYKVLLRNIGITLLMFSPILWCGVKLVYWSLIFSFCNTDEERTKSVYLGEKWLFPSSCRNISSSKGNCFELTFTFSNEVVTIGSQHGKMLTNSLFFIKTTPLINDYSLQNSVFHIIDVEKSLKPSMLNMLLWPSDELCRAKMLVKEKIGVTAISNCVNVVEKHPYVGIVYRYASLKSALIFLDNGKTNQCVSIFVQMRASNAETYSLEEACKAICASAEFE